MSKNSGELLAELVRNGVVESVHSGHLVEIGADGTVLRARGSVDLPIFPRSSVKVFQASGMVRAGLKLTPKQLAVVCSSHSGSAEHFEVILSILASVGLDESALRCATGYPIDEKERRAWGEKPATQLAMNCSGKHSGMIAASVAAGWDRESYTDPSHPLQQLIAEEIKNLTGEPLQHVAADGCGAPLFAVSTLGLARAVHAFTLSDDPVHQEVMAACRAFPEMTGGKGRLHSKLMQEIPGFFMKDGAEGVNVFSMPDGRSCAIKFADGSYRPSGPVVTAVLRGWGVDTPDERVDVLGGGKVVGEIRAVLD
jgi:L-asparaginase II